MAGPSPCIDVVIEIANKLLYTNTVSFDRRNATLCHQYGDGILYR